MIISFLRNECVIKFLDSDSGTIKKHLFFVYNRIWVFNKMDKEGILFQNDKRCNIRNKKIFIKLRFYDGSRFSGCDLTNAHRFYGCQIVFLLWVKLHASFPWLLICSHLDARICFNKTFLQPQTRRIIC